MKALLARLNWYQLAFFAIIIKGLFLGVEWSVALLGMLSLAYIVYERDLKEKKDRLEVKHDNDFEDLKEKVASLEGKMALSGLIRKR